MWPAGVRLVVSQEKGKSEYSRYDSICVSNDKLGWTSRSSMQLENIGTSMYVPNKIPVLSTFV